MRTRPLTDAQRRHAMVPDVSTESTSNIFFLLNATPRE